MRKGFCRVLLAKPVEKANLIVYSNLTKTVQRQMRKAFCWVVLAQPVGKANLSFGSTHHFLSVSPGDVLSR